MQVQRLNIRAGSRHSLLMWCSLLSVASLAETAPPPATGSTSLTTGNAGTPAQNKAIATGFLETLYNQHNPRRAYEQYASPRFHHHAQWSGPGTPEDIVQHNIEGMEKMQKLFPEQHLDIKQVVAEGDLVVVHSWYSKGPGTGEQITNVKKGNQQGPKTGEQVVDIMRIENGRIAEHWEVSQPTTDLKDVF